MTLTQEAIHLITQFELGGSRKYYDRVLAKPSWPGGASGVTIGFGIDLGYESEELEDLEETLTKDQIKRLARVVGTKGKQAQAAVSGVRDIIIPWDFAYAYFLEKTIPKYVDQTLEAFPKAELLPDHAFGALVSIVFNRGPLVDNTDRRREMRKIKEILSLGGDNTVDEDDVREIAKQVRSMARLWPDNTKSDNDLFDRRHAEADLILSSLE